MATFKAVFLLSAAVLGCVAAAAAQEPQQQLSEAELDSIEQAVYGNSRNLEEVVVTADAPMVKVEGNHITYNVEQDPTATGQSALDMLRKVPMVAVDGQDNITLKGESNFKIYVNGRPDPTLSQNASTILKAMPASAVSRVEVISDPGAKYDAEGSGGIINLITERKRPQSGYNGSLTAAVSNRNIMVGAFGAAKWNKVTLNANVNYMNSKMFSQGGEYSQSLEYLVPGTRLESGAKSPRKFEYIGAALSGSWEASELDLVNFSVDYTGINGNMHLDDNRTRMFAPDGSVLWSYNRNARIGMDFNTLSANAAWQHDFNRPDNYLALSYQFDFGKSGNPMDETYSDFVNYSTPYLFHSTSNYTYDRTNTLQLDYSNTLSEHHTIEAGAKTIFRHNSAFSSGLGGNSPSSLSPVAADFTDLTQVQSIYALYALYTLNYGAWSANAGVRYEHTRMGIRYHYGDMDDFTSYLNDVVPNAGITYSFSPAHALGVNYGMRISRPSLQQINPFSVRYSDTEITQGNPNLDSERINKLSLTYRNFGRLLGMSLSLDYNHTGNAISAYSYLDNQTVINTNANIGRKQTAGLTAFLMITPSRNLRLTFNGTGTYNYLRATKPRLISNHGWGGNVSHNGQLSLPADFTLNWFGGYFWGKVNLQSKGGDYYFYSLALARDFLADKSLRLSLSANNFAQKYNKFSNTTHTDAFISHTDYRIAAWTVSLSVQWTIGKSQSRVKSVNSTIKNDDLSTSGAQSAANQSSPGGM